MNKNFDEISYDLHKKHWDNADNGKLRTSWIRKDTIDYWRHERMYKCLDPLIESNPDATWLTLGDGRYGTDANYLLSKKVKSALATDIGVQNLELAKDEGFINEYKAENAEQLSFENNSFDFVLCKESYHHFPRPMIAVYEMLRVAKSGIILMEPQDNNIINAKELNSKGLFRFMKQGIKNIIKRIAGKQPYYEFGFYESVGNYVYTLSKREVEKVALGLNYEYVAFKSIVDHYEEGVENEIYGTHSPLEKKVLKNIKAGEKILKSGYPNGILIAVILKNAPNKDCIEKLIANEFDLVKLPRNPYLQ